MKKKFIPGLLLLALTAGGFSTFTSCKDTDEDQYVELRGDLVTLKADLLKEIADALEKAKQYAKQYTDQEIAKLPEIPDQAQVEQWAKGQIDTWAASSAADGMKAVLQDMLDKMGYTPGGTTPGTSCECPLKNLTTEQAQALVALSGYAKAILGDELDGKGGLFKAVGDNTAELDKLSTSFKQLDKIVNGDPDVPGSGLVKQVEGLAKWFENFTDENGNPMTVATFQEYVKEGAWVEAHKSALEAIETKKDEIAILNKAALEKLNMYYADLEGIDNVYKNIFKDVQLPEGETAWWNYATVMQNIKNNSAAISALQTEVNSILGRINDMVTSLLLQATTNPVFGSVNTPFGVNSMVLMSYYGKLATGLRQFPAKGVSAEYNGKDVDVDWNALTNGKFYPLQNENIIALDDNGKASLGNLWFTVNPGTVNNLDFTGFALVNSKEVPAKVSLTNIYKDDETEFKFGITSRAAGNGNGLYRATASVAPEDLDAIKINIEPGLKDALVDAVKNHTATDIAHMLKTIYNQLQNVCDANALRYTWTSKEKDVNGNWIDRENKVYSNYGLAATAFKPLSFATLYGESFRQIPTISPIEIDKDLVDLDLGTFEVDSKNFALNLNFGKPTFTPLSTVTIETTVTLIDQTTGNTVSGPIEINITDKAQEIQDNITDAIENWIGTGENSLDARVEKSIWYALFNDKDAKDPKYPYDPTLPTGVVADLTAQVNDMMGNIQDKLDNLVDKVNKDYLGKVNSLINKVNKVSARINKILSDPNHYLQATMLYKNGSNQLGLLSTNPKQPSQFKGNGQAIELWATTYNYETLCPVFKKFVGVTKVTKNGTEDCPELAKEANSAAGSFMGEVINGDANRVVLNVKNATAGVYTYEIAYQALDYTGHTSTVKCYVQVVR